MKKKKKRATNNNKGSWVESRKRIGKVGCCRKINVILRDNEEINRRQNFLTQVLQPSFLVSGGVQQWNSLPGKVVLFFRHGKCSSNGWKITGQVQSHQALTPRGPSARVD